MADDYGDILDLFGPDPEKARSQAAILAQAMRQRRGAGDLATVVGGPFAAAGKTFSGDADQLQQQLLGAGQHRAQMDVQRQHYDAIAKNQAAMQALAAGRLDVARELLGLKASEQTTTRDAWNNPVQVPKYGRGGPVGSVLPRSTGAVGGGGGGPALPPGMTPEAFDQAAEKAYRTGKFENYGRANTAMKTALQTRIAQLHPDADLASVAGAYKADSASLGKQTPLLDLTKSWEETGKANLAVLLGAANDVANSGSQWVNKPLRAFLEGATGDPKVTKLRTAHNAVVNEYAKILSGATGGAGVTEGARHEAERMLPLDATPAQYAAAAQVLEQDAGNRLSALARGVQATKERMGAKPEAAPAGVRKFTRGPDGKLVEVK